MEQATYHGKDKRAAIAAAKKRHGMCVWSIAPGQKFGDDKAEFGYWSDKVGMLRSWELEISLFDKD